MASRSPSKSESSKPSTGYTVLARRYRSRNFDELIGQEPIARTLLNAIKAKRTAHAYLFCGTRGVGKTSMARIFAKALNATDDLKEKDAIGQNCKKVPWTKIRFTYPTSNIQSICTRFAELDSP
jgi:DNA polymerase III gamma/tau subunit